MSDIKHGVSLGASTALNVVTEQPSSSKSDIEMVDFHRSSGDAVASESENKCCGCNSDNDDCFFRYIIWKYVCKPIGDCTNACCDVCIDDMNTCCDGEGCCEGECDVGCCDGECCDGDCAEWDGSENNAGGWGGGDDGGGDYGSGDCGGGDYGNGDCGGGDYGSGDCGGGDYGSGDCGGDYGSGDCGGGDYGGSSND